MDRRPRVLGRPFMILLALALVLALIPAIGLPLWAAREENISRIPQSGTYICEELSVSMTFGWPGVLTLPDGETVEFAIDHGRSIRNISGNTLIVEGVYEAHLQEGYVEITFEKLPADFTPGHPYRFTEIPD